MGKWVHRTIAVALALTVGVAALTMLAVTSFAFVYMLRRAL
jgi:hypothetical protein